MTVAGNTAEFLVPHLRMCGYGDDLIRRPFRVNEVEIPVAAFAGRPLDNWSACIAVVNRNGDSRASADKVRPLGASTVFVCNPDGVDWWGMGSGGPTASRSIAWADVEAVFDEHRDELAPSRIYDAKLRRPGGPSRQLWFFDVGLMPAVERIRGETLLRLVEYAIVQLHEDLGPKLKSRQAQEDVYRTVFWLLAAKILHDKEVANFIRIDLTNVYEVFDRIGKHHGETDRYPPFGQEGRRAITQVAKTFAQCGSLADVSSESIAYVYEHALIDKAAGRKASNKGGSHYDIRKELGIHSTPSVLIHHMLAQMWPMIEEINPQDRHVFEPACGHAPFLTAAMRWLRTWNSANHDYLRTHLHGLEADGFAIELAKLALTLADEPYGNKWQVTQSDMFLPGVLAKHAGRAHILLSNPPYEPFSPIQRRLYAKAGAAITASTKATEMLLRALPHLPAGGVFGVVMPQGFLHDKESKPVRERLLTDFDLSEIALFADNLFEHSDHEVAVVIGRRKKPRAMPIMLHYRRVREQGMEAFKERLAFSSEEVVPPRRLAGNGEANLFVPDLVEVWDYLRDLPTLGSVAEIQQGFQFLNAETLKGREVVSKSRRAGWVRAILRADEDYNIWEFPKTVWIDASRKNFRRPGAATQLGIPQVVLNYNPVSREAWRLKAVEDHEGIAVSSNFVVVRPTSGEIPLRAVWAVFNSPVANAYAYSWSGKLHTLVREWRAFPFPVLTPGQCSSIEAAASAYLAVVEESELTIMQPDMSKAIQRALISMDAEVLKLYNLPPRLERQLLDRFTGVERKGVGCDFRGYYPQGFTSYLPLSYLLSENFKRATADATADRFKPGESDAVRDMLAAAAAPTIEE